MEKRALFIGRFQPFHLGHLHVVKEIVLRGYRPVIVIGSAYQSHTRENPFTSGERFEMVHRCLVAEEIQHHIIPIPDINRYGVWVSHVEDLVPPFRAVFANSRIVQSLFLEKGYVVENTQLYLRELYSGTEVRRRMEAGENWEKLLPPVVVEYIREMGGEERVKQL